MTHCLSAAPVFLSAALLPCSEVFVVGLCGETYSGSQEEWLG